MNFLAHLYVADDSADAKMGSVLGDFVKGTPDRRFSAATRDAIYEHRAVDRFTDTHPIVLASKGLMSRHRRRYAGIIVDICYDHFLCRHWSRYSQESLSDFIEATYGSLQAYTGFLPEQAAVMIKRLITDDWLHSYQTVEGISVVLNRVSRRIRRTNTLWGSGEELLQNYGVLDEHFCLFFDDLLNFVKTIHSVSS